MERAINIFRQHFPGYIEESVERVMKSGIAVYTSLPRDVLHDVISRAFMSVKQDIEEGTTSAYPAYVRQSGTRRALQGTPVAEMISGLEYGFQVISDDFEKVFGDDLAPRLWWEQRRREINYAGAFSVMEAFYKAREEIINEQHREIIKLVAPIIPLYHGVMLMPLVGAISAERASHIIESLLEGITRQRSQAVILDVTGMHATDDSAAEHLLRAARTARLLGAQVILVGISAVLAMTFTNAGADLGDLTIRGDLTSGVEHALRLLGRAITKVR